MSMLLNRREIMLRQSPYSLEATAVLKAQFPDKWQIIGWYGLVHPEIVSFVNSYAIEDPKIIYSLVPTLNVIRYIENLNGAWLDTQLYGGLDSFYIKMKLYTPSDSNYYLFGNFNQSGQCGLFKYDNSTISFYYYVGNTAMYVTLGTTNAWIDIETNQTSIIADGVVKAAFPTNSRKLTNSKLLLWGTGVGSAFNGKGKAGRIEMWNDNNEKVRDFVPFVLGRRRLASEVSTGEIQVEGTNGMMDMLSGIFYPNAYAGGLFNISEISVQ